MRFKDRENGREYNLNKVVGTDFWFNSHEELFIAYQVGYCQQVTALEALRSILSRKNHGSALCCLHEEQPGKSNPTQPDTYLGSWLKDFIDKQ